jgi:hypothetical protein
MDELNDICCLEDGNLAYCGEGSEGSLIREEGACHEILF